MNPTRIHRRPAGIHVRFVSGHVHARFVAEASLVRRGSDLDMTIRRLLGNEEVGCFFISMLDGFYWCPRLIERKEKHCNWVWVEIDFDPNPNFSF